MKKYGFIIMGDYDTEKDVAIFETDEMITKICTVKDMDEAKKLIVDLKDQGFGAVETCGAFSHEDIEELIELVDGEMGIARVVAREDQGPLMAKFFAD